MLNTKHKVSAVSPITDWDQIPWRKLEQYVKKLQQRIYKAESQGKKRKVRELQRILLRSKSSLLISIRRVTQLNKGKRTSGVDGFKALTPAERLKLYYEMEEQNLYSHKVEAAKRTYIPKRAGEKKLRPLGIPTVKDRVYQNIVKLALEPQWEVRFESTSYGFRPKRSAHDAIEAIYNKVGRKKQWIFEGDFKGCFDNLDHNHILEKIQGFPAIKIIEKWMKAGYIEEDAFVQTDKGTPQGGIISPLLANIALDGMEEELGVKYIKTNTKRDGMIYEVRDTKTVVRYADDFVIMCETKEEAESMYDKLKPYLAKRGIELSMEKTKVTHLSEGFDFLGFNIRSYKNLKAPQKADRLFIKPSAKSISKFKEKVREEIAIIHGGNATALIHKLNPMIRGFANYFSHVVSKKTFQKIDHWLYRKVFAFVKRLHRNKPAYWIYNTYYKPDKAGISKNKWIFTDPITTNQLVGMSYTPIIRHTLIRYKHSPFDASLEQYFIRRSVKILERDNIGSRTKMAKKQKYLCPICGNHLTDGEESLEVHHKTPKCKGGKDTYDNMILIHTSCHVRWHRTFPAKGPIPTEIQMKAFKKMMRKFNNISDKRNNS